MPGVGGARGRGDTVRRARTLQTTGVTVTRHASYTRRIPISGGMGYEWDTAKVRNGGMLLQPRGDPRAGYEGIPVPLSPDTPLLAGVAAPACVCAAPTWAPPHPLLPTYPS
eukprot:4809553-Prymnesium_polylepis.1